MDVDGFREFLVRNKHSEERINGHIQIVQALEDFLVTTSGKPTQPLNKEGTQEFISRLKVVQKDSYDNVAALARYGLFTNNQPMYLAALEYIDGGEVMDNLHHKLAQLAGEEIRDRVFTGIQLPTIGTPVAERPALMRTVIHRMQALLEEETFHSILAGCLRSLKDEWYSDDRQKYLGCGSLDEYLDLRSNEYLAELEQIREEGRLYFNQVITKEVIEFVRSQPEMKRGVRAGNVLYAAKIPYMAKEYLIETDERMKRYYACHCPWVREAIRSGEDTVSPDFCLCSAGFEKKGWEVIFDQPLQAEVIESVLNGDHRCMFAIHLPDNV